MPSKNPLDIYSYYQLEACIAGNWEPVPGYVYSTTDFRLLLDTIEPLQSGQRLKRIFFNGTETLRADYICNEKGIRK
jgi:hypothetical protein